MNPSGSKKPGKKNLIWKRLGRWTKARLRNACEGLESGETTEPTNEAGSKTTGVLPSSYLVVALALGPGRLGLRDPGHGDAEVLDEELLSVGSVLAAADADVASEGGTHLGPPLCWVGEVEEGEDGPVPEAD